MVFQNGMLSEMVAVGRIEPHAVRLWMRLSDPGTVHIRYGPESGGRWDQETVRITTDNACDNIGSVRIPENENHPGLAAFTRYAFRIVYADDDRLVGEGRFETAPAADGSTPRRFSIALMSCHQPFDADGTPNPKSIQMLRATLKCLAAHDPKYILMMGDQLYADAPPPLSLFDADYFQHLAPPGRPHLTACSADEVRRLFQDRYREFWNIPEWMALHNRYPSYPILDDHDLVDNWGSDPAHQTSSWQAFGQGARRAFLDYQAARVLGLDQHMPTSFHYAFTYGPTATFVMDLRSERTAGESGQLFSQRQFMDLKHFLQAQADKWILFLVLSVPAVHLPRTVAKIAKHLTRSGEDFSDRWSSGAHIRDRDRLFKTIHNHQLRHPRQKIVLLSGDIHIGCAQRVQWHSAAPPFFQLISSGITHSLGPTMQVAANLLMRLNREICTRDGTLHAGVHFLKGARGRANNPYGGMNLGLIEIDSTDADSAPRLRFSLYGHRRERPLCVYRSVFF